MPDDRALWFLTEGELGPGSTSPLILDLDLWSSALTRFDSPTVRDAILLSVSLYSWALLNVEFRSDYCGGCR